jgi:hypothetical protein
MKLLEPDPQPLWPLDFFDNWLCYKDSILQRAPRGPEVLPRLPLPTAVGAARKRARTDDEMADDRHEHVSPTESSPEIAYMTDEDE